MGKVMPRYCNICNRLVPPREIEKGEAIVYGMHCYCSKCKQEVMPIIEALKRRQQKEDTSEKVQGKKPKLQKVTRTQVFFRRPESVRTRLKPPAHRTPKKEPTIETEAVEESSAEVLEAELVEESSEKEDVALEPVDFSKVKMTGPPPPLPPGPVKIGSKLIEVTPDGIRQQISPPRGPTVRPHRIPRPSMRHHSAHPSAKDMNELPPPPPSQKPSYVSAATVGLILLILIVLGGLAYYFFVHRLFRTSSKLPSNGGSSPSQDERFKEIDRELGILEREVEGLLKPQDWLPLKRRINALLSKANASQRIRIKGLLARGSGWFNAQAQKAWKKASDRLNDMIQQVYVDPSVIARFEEAIKIDGIFRGTSVWREYERQLTRIRETRAVWDEYRKLQPKIEEAIKRGRYEEALVLLDKIRFEREKVIPEALVFLRRERERVRKLWEEKRRRERKRRLEAEREWSRVKKDAERMANQKRFDIAIEFLRAFIEAYKSTGPDKDAKKMLKRITANKTRWELSTLVYKGELRKGYWRIEGLSVRRGPDGVTLKAGEKGGRLLLLADLAGRRVLLRLRRLSGVPSITVPKSSSKLLIEMLSTVFPKGQDVNIKMEIRNDKVFYWIGTGGQMLPYAPEKVSGTDGLAFLMPPGSGLVLISVKVTP